MELATVGKILSNGAAALRFAHLQGLVWKTRDRATVGILRAMHLDVLHAMRRLVMVMTNEDGSAETAAELASQVCNGCQKTMATLLELPSNQLHVCIKVINGQTPEGDDALSTWVRSDPMDGRPIKSFEEDAHPILNNSVWCALYGRSDGQSLWPAFNCFACNDLVKRGNLFRCDRADWQRYYKSALVFPLRYAKDAHGRELGNIGFLAFDSPKTGSFRGAPDIYEYREDQHAYKDLLGESTAFHVGAIFADTLGTFLGPAYESWLKQGRSKNLESKNVKQLAAERTGQ